MRACRPYADGGGNRQFGSDIICLPCYNDISPSPLTALFYYLLPTNKHSSVDICNDSGLFVQRYERSQQAYTLESNMAPNAQASYADVAGDAENTGYSEQLGGQGNNRGDGSEQQNDGSSQNQNQQQNQGQNQVSGRDEAPFGTEDTDTSSHGVSGTKAAQVATGTSGGGNTSGGDNSSGGDNNVPIDSAPGYISSVYSEPTKSGKPHGKNITEGGFEANDDNNASFTSDIGGKDDPGRKAVGDFQKMTQSASGGTGPRQQQEGEQRQGGFESLGQDKN